MQLFTVQVNALEFDCVSKVKYECWFALAFYFQFVHLISFAYIRVEEILGKFYNLLD